MLRQCRCVSNYVGLLQLLFDLRRSEHRRVAGVAAPMARTKSTFDSAGIAIKTEQCQPCDPQLQSAPVAVRSEGADIVFC